MLSTNSVFWVWAWKCTGHKRPFYACFLPSIDPQTSPMSKFSFSVFELSTCAIVERETSIALLDRKGNENNGNPNLIIDARLFQFFYLIIFYRRLTKLKSVRHHNRFISNSRHCFGDAGFELDHLIAWNSVKFSQKTAESHRCVANKSLHNSYRFGADEGCQALLVRDDVYLQL